MIGVITVLARLVGFGRQVVFAHTVGTTCLGTAYTTANMVPNIIYDIVLGGALSSVVVPVLAGPARDAAPGVAAGRGEGGPAADSARRISSALLTWTVLLLVPVSAALALAAHPIVTVLLSHSSGCPRTVMAGVGARMLIVFAPQVLLYGLAVVLYGILQSYRRFGAPALAPLLSSLVVIGAYAAFGAIGGEYVFGNRLHELPPMSEYLLSGGTTLGVLALVATAVFPARRLGLRLRPMLRFPPGVGTRVRRLALAGVLTLVAQDASAAVVIVLSNRYGSTGALVIYGFAWAVFMVPFAVLAVPIATSAFPALSAGADARRRAPAAAVGGGFDETAAISTRAVMVASWLGTAVLVGARWPLARVFESHDARGASVLALALAAFAPGLIGYGISANLSRVLYARGRNRATALAIGGGWLLVIAADLVIVPFAAPRHVVPALGLGMSFGLTVSGLALLILVRRDRGALALHGVSRAFLAGLVGRGGRGGGRIGAGGGARGARVLRQRRNLGAGDDRGHRGVRRRRGQHRLRRPPSRGGPPPCPPQLARARRPARRADRAGRAGRRDDCGRDRGACPDARGRVGGARDRRVGPRPVVGRRRVRLRSAGRGDVLAGGVRRPAASGRRGRRAAASAVACSDRDPTWCTRTGSARAHWPSSPSPACAGRRAPTATRASWSPCTTRRRPAGRARRAGPRRAGAPDVAHAHGLRAGALRRPCARGPLGRAARRGRATGPRGHDSQRAAGQRGAAVGGLPPA